MDVEAENLCFENMGYGPYAIFSTEDCCMGSVLGIEDGLVFKHTYDNLPSSSSSIVQSLSSELEKQRMEMDWFLLLESKRLRRSILHEEARQKALIMQKYESRTTTLMLQKEQEISVARNRTRELTDALKMAEMEARSWQKKAAEQEAIVSDLNNRLLMNREDDDDALSFCGSSSPPVVVGGREKTVDCKLCRARRLCVVFFPCRHLCCCKHCEPVLGQCPLCATVKEASLEIFLV